MKYSMLMFYFFCSIFIGGQVSLAAQKGEPVQKKQLMKLQLFKEENEQVSSAAQKDESTKKKQLTIVEEFEAENGIHIKMKGVAHQYVPASFPMEQSIVSDVRRLLEDGDVYGMFGNRRLAIQQLESLLRGCDIKNLFSEVVKRFNVGEIFFNIEEDVKQLTSNLRETLVVTGKNLVQILPEMKGKQEEILRKDFEKLQKLNWSFSNQNMLNEADDIFKKCLRTDSEFNSDNLLDVQMYHVLNEQLDIMKKRIFDISKKMEMAKKLRNLFKHSPCSYKNGYLSSKDSSIYSLLKNTFYSVDLLYEKSKNVRSVCDLSDSRPLVDTIVRDLQNWKRKLEELMSAEILRIQRIMDDVSGDSDEILQEKVLAQYYLSLLKVFDENTKALYSQEGSREFQGIFSYLEKYNAENFDYNQKFEDTLRSKYGLDLYKSLYYRKSLQEIRQLEKNNDNTPYKALGYSFTQLRELFNVREKVEEAIKFLESMKENNAMESVNEVMEKDLSKKGITLSKLIVVLNSVRKDLQYSLDHIKNDRKFRYFIEIYRSTEATVRQLQFFWGTACMEANEVATKKEYQKDAQKRITGLNNIVLALQYSVLAMERLNRFKMDE